MLKLKTLTMLHLHIELNVLAFTSSNLVSTYAPRPHRKKIDKPESYKREVTIRVKLFLSFFYGLCLLSFNTLCFMIHCAHALKPSPLVAESLIIIKLGLICFA